MTSTRGYSGARVVVHPDRAIKLGYTAPDKVVAQGEWLRANEAENLPRVTELLPLGYSMEVLEPLPTSHVDVRRLLDALETSVWKFAPRVLVDTPQTMLYVSRILDTFVPQLVVPALDRISYIRQTEDCLTHGDPTAENVMLRGDTYVLIDPIPATERVPCDKAVDVGKILQSAHGWEAMKGEEAASFTPDDVRPLVSDVVWDVAQHWLVVHFVRILPYASGEVRHRVTAKLYELLGF
jgi:hypothetical protein